MLVLSRQRDESIIIGDNIVVTIVDIRGDKVRLGINAPTEIPVHRQEVYEAIQRENLRTARLDPEGCACHWQRCGPSEPGEAEHRSQAVIVKFEIRISKFETNLKHEYRYGRQAAPF